MTRDLEGEIIDLKGRLAQCERTLKMLCDRPCPVCNGRGAYYVPDPAVRSGVSQIVCEACSGAKISGPVAS